MGKEKTTQTTDSRAIETPIEKEMNQINFDTFKRLQPKTEQLQDASLDLGLAIALGKDLPGFLEGLPGGISEDVTQRIVDKSIEGIRPSLQASGIYDSGMRAELETGASADIRMASEEYNQNLLLNLLNLAVGGQAQIQAPIQSQTAQLSQNLAGLRQNVETTTLKQMNPFLKSFQQSYGENMGTGAAAGTFALMCWVAKEIYGSWEHPKTHNFRYFLLNISPVWFRELYRKHGEKFAKFISNKPIIKLILRPFFEIGSLVGKIESEKNETRLGLI